MLLLHHCRPTAAVSATAIAAAPSGRTHVGVLVARGDGWIIYVCCQQAGTTYVLGADKTSRYGRTGQRQGYEYTCTPRLAAKRRRSFDTRYASPV